MAPLPLKSEVGQPHPTQWKRASLLRSRSDLTGRLSKLVPKICHIRPRCSLLSSYCPTTYSASVPRRHSSLRWAFFFLNSYGMIGWLTNCLLPWLTFPPHLIADQGRTEPRGRGIPVMVMARITETGNFKSPFLSSFCEGIPKPPPPPLSFVSVGASNMVATQQSCMSRNEPRIDPQIESR